jgi:hypothetical protein
MRRFYTRAWVGLSIPSDLPRWKENRWLRREKEFPSISQGLNQSMVLTLLAGARTAAHL